MGGEVCGKVGGEKDVGGSVGGEKDVGGSVGGEDVGGSVGGEKDIGCSVGGEDVGGSVGWEEVGEVMGSVFSGVGNVPDELVVGVVLTAGWLLKKATCGLSRILSTSPRHWMGSDVV